MILSGTDHSGRLARWRLRLLEFDFSVAYKKGAKNTIADAISRLPTYGEAQLAPDTEVPCYLIHGPASEVTPIDEGGAGLDAFCAETSNHTLDDKTYSSRVLEVETECPHLHKTEDFIDEDYDEVDCEDDIDAITATTEAEVTEPLAPFSLEEIRREQMKDDLCQKLRRRSEKDPRYVENRHGILCRRSPLDNLEQIVLTEALRRQAPLLAHYPRMAGHPSGSRVFQTLRRTFYWPSMALDAYNTVRQCSSCKREWISLRKHSNYLRLFPAQAPLEYVAIDILGPLPRTTSKQKYLLCITDRYPKMVRTVPLKNVTAATVATAFCEQWVLHYGSPVRLLSDNGGQFTSKFFQDICAILGTQKLFKTAYHPQTNGQVERFNHTILAGLRRFCSEHGRDWEKFSHAVTYAYNTTVHRATGLTPLQLVLTRPPFPLNLENVETVNPEAYGSRQTEQRSRQVLRSLMQSADKHLTATQARYKRDFDKRVRKFNTDITPGELVFVKRETATESEERHKTSRGEAIGYHNLRSKAAGPFPVVSVTIHAVTIMRDGIADKISKDCVIRAPSPQRQTSGATERNTADNPADCTTPEASSTATPRLTGSSQDAVLHPAKRAVGL